MVMAPAPAIKKRHVTKWPRGTLPFKTLSFANNLYKAQAKDETHEEMMQRFQLRRLSSDRGSPSKFGRGKTLVIEKATGGKRRKPRRRSLERYFRSLASPTARNAALRGLTMPITPKSWTSTMHGILMLAVYHFQLLYLPFAPSYYAHGPSFSAGIMIALETVFLLDLVLNLNTAYVEQGVLVTARHQIARHYLCKWFALDLLSAIPFQAMHCIGVAALGGTHSTVQGVQLTLMALRLLRVTFLERGVLLGRVMRIGKLFSEWLRYSRYSHLLGIAQLMWLVLLIAHYLAYLWHVVTMRNSDLKQANQSAGEQYVADFYYAVSLIQGQGNSVGAWEENVFSSVAIIVGSVILAIVFGEVALLVSNFNANSTNYHRKMEAVYATMSKMDLPHKLRERVHEYYTHVWLEYEALDGNIHKFRDELTHTLRIEIGLYKHMNLVAFWADCTPDFLTQIVLSLGVRVYMPDDYVVRRREIGSEMMMINLGYCKLSKPIRREKKQNLATYAPGSTIVNQPVLSPEYDERSPDVGVQEVSESESESDSHDSSSDESPRATGHQSSTAIRRLSGSTVELQGLDFTSQGNNSSHVLPQQQTKSNKFRIYLHPGQAFGEMSLMNYKRQANIRAVTFVEMCVLDRETFQKIISRYPEDRRRVLTKTLESCIEKKEVPFPWENIIEAVSNKRRSSGLSDFSRASIIATMTSSEAARILVEAIDVSAPDESIKYGFQSFDHEFVDTPALRRANSVGAKIRDALQRSNSGIRLFRTYSRRLSKADSCRSSATSTGDTETESDISGGSSYGGGAMEKSVESMLQLMHSMADNIARLQQDVSELKRQAPLCKSCGEAASSLKGHRVAPAAPEAPLCPVIPVGQPASVNGRLPTLYDRSNEVHPMKAATFADGREAPSSPEPRTVSGGCHDVCQQRDEQPERS
jgi:CRP-like cAMP-binding protein